MGRFAGNFYIRKIINILRAKKIKKQFYIDRNTDKYTSEKKDVVFCANGFVSHGGLADRIYGILTTYAICKIKNWSFAINFNSPYNLEAFLVPNKYNWLISEKGVLYNSKLAKPVFRLGGCNNCDFDSIKPNKKQIHLYSNCKCLEKINAKYNTSFTWAGLFNELFKISDALQRELDDIKEKLPKRYISVQIRVLNAFGDFPDCGSEELIESEKKQLLDFCQEKIKSLYLEKKIPILLTSDSQRLIDYFQTTCKEGICFIPGTILHSDNKEISGYEAHKKTFIDLFCLAAGENIYQIENEHIYRSGFSILAAQITERSVLWL